MKIATWNINSVRLRIEQVLKFTNDQNIDLLCLQETKTEDQFFPSNDFFKIGMKYQYFRGEKSYNGVAILSKIDFEYWNKVNPYFSQNELNGSMIFAFIKYCFFIYSQNIFKQAILTATPSSTCSFITLLLISSASLVSISIPLFIGPGCIMIASGFA